MQPKALTVYLAVVTDGRFGVEPHAKIPAGDTLAAVRAGEIKCAAESYGDKAADFIGVP